MAGGIHYSAKNPLRFHPTYATILLKHIFLFTFDEAILYVKTSENLCFKFKKQLKKQRFSVWSMACMLFPISSARKEVAE